MRVVLRGLVLLQLVITIEAARTIHWLVGYGTEVMPATVVRAVVALVATIVALRATFGPEAQIVWRTALFVACQVVVAGTVTGVFLVPLSPSADLIAPGSVLPPNEIFGSGSVLGAIQLEFALTAGLAILSVPAALWQLARQRHTAIVTAVPLGLGIWVAGAALATGVVVSRYASRFAATQRPDARVQQLFATNDWRVRWTTAKRLIEMPPAEQQAVRGALVAGLERPDGCDQAWAAYVLVATGADDGAAMARLRALLATPAAVCAAQQLAQLGAKAAPAQTELIELVKQPARNADAAQLGMAAAESLGQIGAPAAAAVPFLFALVRDQRYPELRGNAAVAIDRIDPSFASRCTIDAATMNEAWVHTGAGVRPLAVRAECLSAGAADGSHP